jgi:hypothetical protein
VAAEVSFSRSLLISIYAEISDMQPALTMISLDFFASKMEAICSAETSADFT